MFDIFFSSYFCTECPSNAIPKGFLGIFCLFADCVILSVLKRLKICLTLFQFLTACLRLATNLCGIHPVIGWIDLVFTLSA